MIAASVLALIALGGYAVLCAVQPFKGGRLRAGRRAWTAWRRIHHNGTR